VRHVPGSGLPSQPADFRARGRLFDPKGNAILLGEDRTIPTVAGELLLLMTKQGVPNETIPHILMCAHVGWCKLAGIRKDELLRNMKSEWDKIGARDGGEHEV
jgi:hypothetical protein